MQLDLVAIVVHEYDPAIEFFVRRLGFELIEDSPALNDGRTKRWVVVRPPGAATGLLLARADGEQQRSMTRLTGVTPRFRARTVSNLQLSAPRSTSTQPDTESAFGAASLSALP